jgi:hypothetical protein
MSEAQGYPTPPELAVKILNALSVLHQAADMKKAECHPLGTFGGYTIEQTHGDYRFEIKITPKH